MKRCHQKTCPGDLSQGRTITLSHLCFEIVLYNASVELSRRLGRVIPGCTVIGSQEQAGNYTRQPPDPPSLHAREPDAADPRFHAITGGVLVMLTSGCSQVRLPECVLPHDDAALVAEPF